VGVPKPEKETSHQPEKIKQESRKEEVFWGAFNRQTKRSPDSRHRRIQKKARKVEVVSHTTYQQYDSTTRSPLRGFREERSGERKDQTTRVSGYEFN